MSLQSSPRAQEDSPSSLRQALMAPPAPRPTAAVSPRPAAGDVVDARLLPTASELLASSGNLQRLCESYHNTRLGVSGARGLLRSRAMYGAIDIGGTKLLAACAGEDLHPQRVVHRATPPDDPIGVLTAMLDDARDGAGLEAIAVATPGPFDRERGMTLLPPNMPPAWQNLPLADALSAHFGCRVVVENDANCAALAEALHGAAAGLAPGVYYTSSTGTASGGGPD